MACGKSRQYQMILKYITSDNLFNPNNWKTNSCANVDKVSGGCFVQWASHCEWIRERNGGGDKPSGSPYFASIYSRLQGSGGICGRFSTARCPSCHKHLSWSKVIFLPYQSYLRVKTGNKWHSLCNGAYYLHLTKDRSIVFIAFVCPWTSQGLLNGLKKPSRMSSLETGMNW